MCDMWSPRGFFGERVFWLHCQSIGEDHVVFLTSVIFVKFELPKQSQNNPRSSKIMMGTITGASDIEAGLGQTLR